MIVFWNEVAARASADFRGGDLTGGLARALATVAERLAEHFPPQPTDRNELPDQVLGV